MKIISQIVVFPLSFFLLASTAFAILDQDNDGMSDIWEAQFGFSISSSSLPGQAPNDDSDGDGVTNQLESIAGTNPLSAAQPLGTLRVLATANSTNPLALDLQWQQVTGKQYQVQSSSDLTAASWSPSNTPTLAGGAFGSFTTPPRSAAVSMKFFRTRVTDVDSDSDGLSNSEENTLGTDPSSADSDGDGILDKVEVTQGSSPTDASDNGSPPPTPTLLPMKLKIYTSASLATDYQNGGINGLLTPYKIKIYEQNLATGVETLVHTTPEYGGSMFSLTDTVDLPNLANDPNKRYNAQIDLPIIGTDVFSQPFRAAGASSSPSRPASMARHSSVSMASSRSPKASARSAIF